MGGERLWGFLGIGEGSGKAEENKNRGLVTES